MHPIAIVVALAGLVVGSTIAGFVVRARSGLVVRMKEGRVNEGRMREGRTRGRRTVPEELPGESAQVVSLPGMVAGSRATLLQFSTAACSPCVPTRAALRQLAEEIDGVTHVDIDLASQPTLVSRFAIMQTPTTLILDAGGRVRGRIGGAPRVADLRAALDDIIAA